jgi:hypothetical protein
LPVFVCFFLPSCNRYSPSVLSNKM